MKRFQIILLLFSAGAITCQAQSPSDEISGVLDALHTAASEADFDGYFDLYAENSVFLGTDATERWPIAEFKEYTRGRFEDGGGWTYQMNKRNIFVSSDGNTAWFDEMLYNENLGVTRGTGALILVKGEWKIAQYNLTIPVPNDLARDLVGRIRAMDDN